MTRRFSRRRLVGGGVVGAVLVAVAGVIIGEDGAMSTSSPTSPTSPTSPPRQRGAHGAGPTPVDSSKRFPAGAGHVDVTELGADPTGRVDCTAVVQAGITRHGPGVGHPLTLYWPAGRYLLSGPLLPKDATGRWCSSVTHQGEGTALTVLVLADGTPGYGDVSSPRPVLLLASQPESGEDGTAEGSGNGGFHNFVFDLTVDVGDNPGAVAIDYLANNVGAIRRTSLEARAGHTGVAMTRRWPGPCLVDRLSVSGGFEYSTFVDNYFYSVMFERCAFGSPVGNGRNVVGFHQCTFAASLRSTNGNGVSVFVAAQPGLATPVSATRTSGARLVGAAPAEMAAFRVPGALAPDVAWDPPADWVDATKQASLQAAVNAGRTVYYPVPAAADAPSVTDTTVILPAGLEHLLFMDAGPDCSAFTTGRPVFETTGDTTRPLTIERGYMALPSTGDPSWIVHRSSRPLVIRDITLEGGGRVPGILQMPGAGPIYVDDAYCSVQLAPKGSLYARQLNWESTLCPAVTNPGGTAWIFGLKTERAVSPVILTTDGGRSELPVGEFYPVGGVVAGDCPIVTVDAAHAVQFCTWTNGPVGPPTDYSSYVELTTDGRTVTYGRSDFQPRGYGTYVMQAT